MAHPHPTARAGAAQGHTRAPIAALGDPTCADTPRTFWDAFCDSLADMFDFGQFFAPRPRDDRPARETDAEAPQRDAEAIRGHWEAVGGYLWHALGQVEA